MNTLLLTIILVPIIEIYLFIKIGSQIGAFNTISLIFITAIIGVFYARYEGLNTLKSGFSQLVKNELPAYEIISGAAIAVVDDLELVRSGLDDTMRDALQAMRVRWHEDEKVDDLRLSAYMIAIQKIALSYQSKSLL